MKHEFDIGEFIENHKWITAILMTLFVTIGVSIVMVCFALFANIPYEIKAITLAFVIGVIFFRFTMD